MFYFLAHLDNYTHMNPQSSGGFYNILGNISTFF